MEKEKTTLSSLIVAILDNEGIKPDQEVNTASGKRTAFQVLEGHVLAGLDEIDEIDIGLELEE